jgi:hypothetical protein
MARSKFYSGQSAVYWQIENERSMGDGYVEALRKVYKDNVPNSADFVMFWWYKAAEIVRTGRSECFGFITTNSIKQTFNRRILQSQIEAKDSLSIVFAIPDHPWVDSTDGAAVRIAMTVGEAGKKKGRLHSITTEIDGEEEKLVVFNERKDTIHADLSVGANVSTATPLKSNQAISSFGMMLAGAGFLITLEEAERFGLATNPMLQERIRPFRNGKDLTSTPREVYVIDMTGLSESEVRVNFPEIYQHLLLRVKPERDHNRDMAMIKNWWLFGRTRNDLRVALKDLKTYISTPETSKHRFFMAQDVTILPDHKLINLALGDFYFLGILSSHIHIVWALATGGRLEDRPVYNTTLCFQNFPFPTTTKDQKAKIRTIAENLDAHRKRQQGLHPSLTITGMYNVLEKLRTGKAVDQIEQKVHEQELVGILLQLHNELDVAVAEAYGWPSNLTEEVILAKLVALNKERAEEEGLGIVHWLRPEYQNAQGVQQASLKVEMSEVTSETVTKVLTEWPKNLADQAQVVQQLVRQYQQPVTAYDLSNQFKPGGKASKTREQQIENLLQTLNSLGLIRRTEKGSYIK